MSIESCKVKLLSKLALVLFIIFIVVLLFLKFRESDTGLVMGGRSFEYRPCSFTEEVDKEVFSMDDMNEYFERFFRPSKLPILNNRSVDFYKYHDQDDTHNSDISKVKAPSSLVSSPYNTIINYFSILREGENLVPGKMGGCGTVGSAHLPFPVTYTFFTDEYKERVSYDSYLKSFEGIGHTNLIKLKRVTNKNDSLRYFIEVETIEGSDKDNTFFAYYYGYIYIKGENNRFLISDIELTGEDFLCSPYHGWNHDAEAVVDIIYGGWCDLVQERYLTEKEGYTINVYVKGKDGNTYRFEFFRLTNGDDVEIERYIKTSDNKWLPIAIDIEKCLERKKKAE